MRPSTRPQKGSTRPQKGSGTASKSFTERFSTTFEHKRRRPWAASELRANDQRKPAFEQSSTDRFSNALFTGTPSAHARFTNIEFHAAVQSAVRAPLSPTKHALGQPFISSSNGPNHVVDLFGNNLKKMNHATAGGALINHNSILNIISFWLKRVSVPHRGGLFGKP
jgi:hypothetical protein